MHRIDAAVGARPSDVLASRNRVAETNRHSGEVAVRRLETAAVIDRHRDPPRYRPGEAHEAGRGGPHGGPAIDGEVHAPMPGETTRGLEATDDGAIDGTRQTGTGRCPLGKNDQDKGKQHRQHKQAPGATAASNKLSHGCDRKKGEISRRTPRTARCEGVL